MATIASDGRQSVDIRTKMILLISALIGYGCGFWPNSLVLRYGSEALGYPKYEGFVGALLPHLLLYSTLPALVCGLLWWVLSRNRLMMPVPLGNVRASLPIGIAAGLVSLFLLLVLAWATMPAGSIHWIDPQPWKIAGNIFSNFFEEFIFRGFILIALMAVIGFWPAAIVSSVMWAAMHTQYPLEFQAFIAFSGILWAWAGRRARSLWAPYTAHMTLDVIADCLIG
jgi:membrane protease YdiL (CAAX protease family)